jgi:hypothetical protein
VRAEVKLGEEVASCHHHTPVLSAAEGGSQKISNPRELPEPALGVCWEVPALLCSSVVIPPKLSLQERYKNQGQ